MDPPNITPREYSAFQEAFNFMNRQMFGGILPSCLITLQRRKGTYGYFWHQRFRHRADDICTDEIALNPDAFPGQSDKDILGTLGHEMVHLWQAHFGRRHSRGGYHNREWAEKMCGMGLIPSHTGKVGGKMTGQRMSHYISATGLFAEVIDDLIRKGFRLNWESSLPTVVPGVLRTKKMRDRSKIKFSCQDCGLNAWAKERARLDCGVCHSAMVVTDD